MFEILDRPVEEDIVVDLSTAELILMGVRAMKSLDHIRSAARERAQAALRPERHGGRKPWKLRS